jgi:hypothetical protein
MIRRQEIQLSSKAILRNPTMKSRKRKSNHIENERKSLESYGPEVTCPKRQTYVPPFQCVPYTFSKVLRGAVEVIKV